ncbi:MAG: universal stress protein [Planctomycetia bacterium]|nr:universal stress protein [Planctomycetia bacterium]
MPYKNIAIALAGKDDEIPVIDEAVRLSINLKAKLCIIHVNDLHAGDISMMMDSPKEYIKDDFIKMFHDAGHEEIAKRIKVKIIKNSSVSKGIAELISDCDLLIMGHDKMGKVKEVLTDSIDEVVVNVSNCPVLIIPK